MSELQGYVAQYATAPGTASTVQLTTSIAGRRTFADVYPSGGTTFYFIDDGAQAEWGVGAYNSASNTLSRTTVTGNTAGTTVRLSFASGGAVRVFNSVPPERALWLDADGIPASMDGTPPRAVFLSDDGFLATAAAVFDASGGQPGYFTLPGSIIVNFGLSAGGIGARAVTFAKEYGTGVRSVVHGVLGAGGGTGRPEFSDITTTGMTLNAPDTNTYCWATFGE